MNTELEGNLIYIVDDNEPIRELLQEILEEESFTIKTFSEAESVLKQSRFMAPDLFLLDINMPGMNGIELCQKIKEMESLSHIPVIFLSGLLETEDKVKGFQAGGSDYITKPFIPIDVISRVKTQIKLKLFIDQTLSFNTALEKGIAQRTRELQKAKEKAEQADRAKTQFLSNINHELRTPLNGLLGMLDLMKQNKTEDEEMALNIELAEYAAKHLSHLINDILDYTQLENKSMLFTYRRFSVNELLDNISRIYQPQCLEKGLSIQTKPLSGDSSFSGDSNRVMQILNNLISNSIKYSLKGTISVSSQRLEDNLEICVQDEGVGIGEKEKADIFKPYVQLKSSYVAGKQGLGLGLAITKNILEQMGGSIELESGPSGSVFTVTIPQHKEDSYSDDILNPSTEEKSAEILVVEDDTVSLYYMEQILEEAGYTVSTAIDGREAREILKTSSFDLILMDIGLPHVSGLELIKELSEGGPVPVIAVTAYFLDKDIRRFKKAGFRDVLPKPVNSRLLLDKIKSLL